MDDSDLANIFTYHPPTAKHIKLYEEIRNIAYHYAIFINAYCPESYEKCCAIHNLQQTVMWANAAIARHEHN